MCSVSSCSFDSSSLLCGKVGMTLKTSKYAESLIQQQAPPFVVGLFSARTFALLLCASLVVCFLFVVFRSLWFSVIRGLRFSNWCLCAFRRGSLRVLFFRGLCLGKSRVRCVLQFGHSRSLVCFVFSCELLVLLTVGSSWASCGLCAGTSCGAQEARARVSVARPNT